MRRWFSARACQRAIGCRSRGLETATVCSWTNWADWSEIRVCVCVQCVGLSGIGHLYSWASCISKTLWKTTFPFVVQYLQVQISFKFWNRIVYACLAIFAAVTVYIATGVGVSTWGGGNGWTQSWGFNIGVFYGCEAISVIIPFCFYRIWGLR